MFEPVEYESYQEGAIIKVIGVGGGGGNALNHMVQSMGNHAEISQMVNGIQSYGSFDAADQHASIGFFVVNTDAQALRKSKVTQTIQIGNERTKGLGAGANPNIGREAAEEDQDAIRAMLEGADMVFIAAGMGGGTGTGAAPVVAQIAKELGILTVAVVTKPFVFEGKKRMHYAELGIQELSKHVDSLIVIPNEKLLKVLGKNISLIDAFSAANDILNNSVRGISDMITSPGLINVDFADVRTVMSEMGHAMMGTGIGSGDVGDGRAEKAAQEAVASPLLEDIDLSGAKGVLVNISAGLNLTLDEFRAVGDTVRAFASEDATVIVGTSLMPELEDEIRVTIVATGIGANTSAEAMMPKQRMMGVATPTQGTAHGFEPAHQPLQGTQSHHQYGAGRVEPKNEFDLPPAARNLKSEDEKLLNVAAFLRKNNNAD
ncbi:cell division protein FtsZ [Conservatibacter flavescens]|uniref:Cell division protein FtsZ n=1 Tax=Conservatibacter flavescens TaxID=28161 RepID=A0A2M8S330_9PAST|nr:cell division protein FtsZ [Conservatibacter flavescens]PJG85561.1 cell division protein FtsZ [Conservatibacter flavescens]